MRRPGEYLATYRDGVLTGEYDGFACAHCNRTVVLKAATDPTSAGSILAPQPHWDSEEMGVCLMCSDGAGNRGLLCPQCHADQNSSTGRVDGKCKNFERQLEQRERGAALYRSVVGG